MYNRGGLSDGMIRCAPPAGRGRLLLQLAMIRRVKELCEADERVVAALMYGSFAKGQGDEFSDIEFYVFVRDDARRDFDVPAWIAHVSPVATVVENEWGTTVALFDGLVRGEFHFEPASVMAKVATWGWTGESPPIDAMLAVDRTGELRRHLEAWRASVADVRSVRNLQTIADRFLNVMIFGSSVLRRGERARALDLLTFVHRYLLWMARATEGRVEHWSTPSRLVEREISPAAYQRFSQCTAALDPGSLEKAYASAWVWGKELLEILAAARGIASRPGLVAGLDRQLRELISS
jgi:lincosamide nucleotidyltransferase